MIEVELHDGRILEFPDGTADAVIDGVVQNELGLVTSAPQKPSGAYLPAKDGGNRELDDVTKRGLSFGTRSVLEGLGDIPDVFLNKPINAIFGTNLQNPGTAIADMLGLEKAKTEGDEVLGAAIRGGASAIPTLGAGLAPSIAASAPKLAKFLTAAPVEQVVGGALSGAASERVRQNGVGPAGQFFAGLAAGVLPGTASFGGTTLGRGAKTAYRAGEAFTDEGQKRIAAEAIRDMAGDGIGDVQKRLADAEFEIVPGSHPTLGQVANNAGLAVAEKARHNIGGRYLERYDQQRAARTAEAENILGRMEQRGDVRNANLEARREAQPEAFSKLDQHTVDDLDNNLLYGHVDAPEADYGMALGQIFGENYKAFKNRVRNAYESIDPEGSARFNVEPLKNMFASTLDQGQFAPQPPADIQRIMGELESAVANGETASYRGLQNIRSRLRDLADGADKSGDLNLQRIAVGMKNKLDDYLLSAAEYADSPVKPKPGSEAYKGVQKEASALAKALVEVDNPFWDNVWKRLDADSLAKDFPDAKRELSQLHGRGIFAQKGQGLPVDALADELKRRGYLAQDADSSDLVELLKSKTKPKRQKADVDAILDEYAQYGSGFSPEQARQFLEATALRREQALAFESDFNKAMSRGTLRDDQIAGNYFRPGAAGDGAAKDFMRAMGDSPNARTAMHNFILEKFRSEALDKGALSVKKMESWMKRYHDALLNFPDTRRTLENILGKQKAAEQVKAGSKEGVRLAGEANKRRNALGAQVLARGRDFKPKLGKREVAGTFEDDLRRLSVLSPDEIRRVKALQQDAERVRRADELSKVRGSPTFQNFANKALQDTFIGKSKSKNGGLLHGLLGRGADLMYGRADQNINAILDDAFLDPSYALELLTKYRSYTPDVSLGDILKKQAAGAANVQLRNLLDAIAEEDEKEDKKRK